MARRLGDCAAVLRDPVTRQNAEPSSHEPGPRVVIQSIDLRTRRIEGVVRSGRHWERHSSFRWFTEP